jgi:hypothetical protein
MTTINTHEDLWDRKIIAHPKDARKNIKARGEMLRRFSKEAFMEHQIMSEGEGRWTIAQKYKDTGKWQSTYLTEIIVCRVGVFVSGDIDSVIFAGGDRGSSPKAMVGWVGRHDDVEYYLHQKASMGFNCSNRNPAETTDNDTAIAEMQDRAYEVYREICESVVEEYSNGYEYEAHSLVVPDDDDDDGIPSVPALFNQETGKIECSDENVLERLLWVVSERLQNSQEMKAWDEAITDMRHGRDLELVTHSLYDTLEEAGVSDVWEIVGDIGVVVDSRVYYAHAACAKLCELLDARETDREAATEGAP